MAYSRLAPPDDLEQYGMSPAEWRVFVNRTFPDQPEEMIYQIIDFCNVYKLPYQPAQVHVVNTWNAVAGKEVPHIYAGIKAQESRASATGEFAGEDPVQYGPAKMVEYTFKGQNGSVGVHNIEVPEYATSTIYRIVQGQRVAFSATRFFSEAYGLEDPARGDLPNEMWRHQPRMMLEKCARMAALRRAFGDVTVGYIPEEMQNAGKPVDGTNLIPVVPPFDPNEEDALYEKAKAFALDDPLYADVREEVRQIVEKNMSRFVEHGTVVLRDQIAQEVGQGWLTEIELQYTRGAVVITEMERANAQASA
jgi:phage recombination protein Bet